MQSCLINAINSIHGTALAPKYIILDFEIAAKLLQGYILVQKFEDAGLISTRAFFGRPKNSFFKNDTKRIKLLDIPLNSYLH